MTEMKKERAHHPGTKDSIQFTQVLDLECGIH